MDTLFEDLHGSMNNNFRFEHDPHNLDHGFYKGNREFIDPVSPPTNSDLQGEPSPSSGSGSSSEGDSVESSEFSNAIILRFINEVLMDEQEDLEKKPCMLHDCLALQTAEKSFYDVIGEEYPSPLPCLDRNFDVPNDQYVQSFSTDSSIESITATSLSNLDVAESNWAWNQDEVGPFTVQNSIIESPEDTLLTPDSSWHLGGKAVAQGKSGFFLPTKLNGTAFAIQEKNQSHSTTVNGSEGKKGHHRHREFGSDSPEEEEEEEGRRTKHTAVYPDFSEPTEIFDEVLLCPKPTLHDKESCGLDEKEDNKPRQQRKKQQQTKRTKQKKRNSNHGLVDFTSLLTQCAQAVASYDQRTATQLLKQIKDHSSPHGDESQRLAYYFANALEVRLSGGTPSYNHLGSNGASAYDLLKAYQVYITACPFKRMSQIYANRTILKLSEKANRLHIIDFGVLYGFQWPCLIQRLSERPGGPPMLRFTGIEFPQTGFRPSERVIQTGRRLANYCERFKVPFECNMIAQKWETVKIEDLKLDRNELTVVNCLDRMKNLPDETVIEDCPRDEVLRLIRRINPTLFIHGVLNGNHNAPFFLTRFREALFHFSALFDMFEASLPREDQHRLMFEQEVFGRDVMNVVAGEGIKRVERPETYKQWQVRNLRAGFRQVGLDGELVKLVRNMVKKHYHRDFVVDEDGMWMLQGWKGRIFQAMSFWQPA
jgi:hypothetical protein